MNTITVLLADDHAIIREGVMELLKQEKDMAVIGEAENGHQAVAAVRQLRPDVVVMDISMPQLNGMEAARQILQHSPGTRIIILSAHHDAAFIALVTAIGASGFLNKHSSAHELPAAIREVHQGRSFFRSPSLSILPDEDDTSHVGRADSHHGQPAHEAKTG
jgi:DNA-binding NarL/FixJ family response regulator